MSKSWSARVRQVRLSVALTFALTIVATSVLSVISVAPVNAAAYEVNRVQYEFAEAKSSPTATFSSTPDAGSLLITSAFSRTGSSAADHVISGDGWEKRVSLDTLINDDGHRRALSVWTKTAGDSEPTAVTVSGDKGTVKMLIQEFSTPAPAEFMFLDAASNDNGDTNDDTSLSTGTTAVNSGSQMWVSVLGIRNNAKVNIGSASWTAPIGDTVHSDGENYGRTLNSGFGLGVGDLAAESTATWKGSNSGASAAILVFSVPDMCYLPAQDGRTIVDLTVEKSIYEYIRADKSMDDATYGPFDVDLPAGTYSVILHSWDDHNPKDRTQPNESWYLQLWNADPVNFQNTSPISDLADDQTFITEVVDSELVIEEDVALVQAFHASYPGDNPNSIYPICVAFDEIVEEEGEVLGDETQVDVPTGPVNAGYGFESGTSALAIIGLIASAGVVSYGVVRFSRQLG